MATLESFDSHEITYGFDGDIKDTLSEVFESKLTKYEDNDPGTGVVLKHNKCGETYEYHRTRSDSGKVVKEVVITNEFDNDGPKYKDYAAKSITSFDCLERRRKTEYYRTNELKTMTEFTEYYGDSKTVKQRRVKDLHAVKIANYDTLGRLVQEISKPYGNKPEVEIFLRKYDDGNREIYRWNGRTLKTVSYAFDEKSNMVKSLKTVTLGRSKNSKVIERSECTYYPNNGKLKTRSEGGNIVERRFYDTEGRIVRIEIPSKVSTFEYIPDEDGFGHIDKSECGDIDKPAMRKVTERHYRQIIPGVPVSLMPVSYTDSTGVVELYGYDLIDDDPVVRRKELKLTRDGSLYIASVVDYYYGAECREHYPSFPFNSDKNDTLTITTTFNFDGDMTSKSYNATAENDTKYINIVKETTYMK